MIREDGNIPELDDLHEAYIVFLEEPDRSLYFHAQVGKFYASTGHTVTRIVWNKNWLIEKGISRWEVWATKVNGHEELWKGYDNPVRVAFTRNTK